MATKLPKGKLLYATPGVADEKARLLAFARRCADCPDKIEAVTAESVGLEWHMDGKACDWSAGYRRGRFVILQNVRAHTPGAHERRLE